METLVIGYGNPLRGDDGLGPAAASIVDSWHFPGVKVVVVQQLVPELIEDIVQAGRVLFIDAACNDLGGAFTHLRLEPSQSPTRLGHYESPVNLLRLASELTGGVPPAWLVSIGGVAFRFSSELSDDARRHLAAALDWIRGFIGEPARAT